ETGIMSIENTNDHRERRQCRPIYRLMIRGLSIYAKLPFVRKRSQVETTASFARLSIATKIPPGHELTVFLNVQSLVSCSGEVGKAVQDSHLVSANRIIAGYGVQQSFPATTPNLTGHPQPGNW